MTARNDYVDYTYMLSPCLRTIHCERCECDSLCNMYADIMDLDRTMESVTCYTEGESVYGNYNAWQES